MALAITVRGFNFLLRKTILLLFNRQPCGLEKPRMWPVGVVSGFNHGNGLVVISEEGMK